MAKTKYEKISKNIQKKTFYYEIFGIIYLILFIITILKFGFVGDFLWYLFKLFFGDWFFLFLLILFMVGIYYLILHEKFKINSIRIVGIILVVTAMMILSHFPMHNFISEIEGNYIKNTFNVYFDAFKDKNNDFLIGGGIIGSLCFYLLFYLFSDIGTKFLSIIILLIGFIFIGKLTIKESFNKISKIFNYLIRKLKKFLIKLKLRFSSFANEYDNKRIKINKSIIENLHFTNDEELLFVNNKIKEIQKALLESQIFVKIDSKISSNLIKISLKSYEKLNFQQIIEIFKKLEKTPFVIKSACNDTEIYLELDNPFKRNKFLCELCNYGKNIYFIKEDQELVLNKHLILIGADLYIEQYLNFLIVLCLIKKNHLFSNQSLTNNLDQYIEKCSIDEIIALIDKRINEYNNNKISNYIEFMKIKNEEPKFEYYFIHDLHKEMADSSGFEKIFYCLNMGIHAGIIFIVINDSMPFIDNKILSLCSYKIYFKNNFYYVDNLHMNLLNPDIECYFEYLTKHERCSYPVLTNNEKKKL